MDFAADAVFDVTTPHQRPAARAPSADASGEPSFEDHLNAATHEDAPVESTPASTPEHAPESEELLGGPEGPPVAAQTPQAEQAAAPVLVQMIAAATPPTPQAETQTAPTPGGAAPVAPTSAPAPTDEPATPMQAASAGAGKSAAPSPSDATPGAAPSPQEYAAQNKSAAPQQAPPTQATPATQQQTATQPAATPATTAAAATAPATQAVAGAAAAPAPSAQAQKTPDAARHAKSTRTDAKGDAAEAPAQTPSAPASTAAPRTIAKSAAPQSASKDAAIVPPLDAPDTTPAQTQSTSSAAAATAQSSHAHHAEADSAAVRTMPAAQQVAREIVRRFDGGNTRFELRLDPPELGRIEVKLEVSRDHRVTAVIAADSPQALTELVRHSRELEQALQGAGLELTDNGLSFDLRQGSERDQAAEFGGSGFEAAALNEEQTQPAARPLGYERWRGVRVDMMV